MVETMRHPSFDVINILAHAEFGKPDGPVLQAFKDKILHMPVYVPGNRIAMPNQRTATRFNLDKGIGKALPSVPLYVRETDAIKAHGPHAYFAAKFQLALLFAETYRADGLLVEGAERMCIAHEKLLALSDMVGLGEKAKPMSAHDIAAQRTAMLAFAIRARAYCARQADVHSLHLATLDTSGAKAMLVGALSAAHYPKHAHALKEISMQVLRPDWRFMLLDEAHGHAAIIKDLRDTAPCYMKVGGQGWWRKLTGRFESPALSLTGLTLN
jgi:hypothetical protein